MSKHHRKSINLQGIVNFAQLEDILSAILDKINSQDEVLSRLQSLSASFVQKSLLMSKLTEIFDILSGVNAKLEILQSASTSVLGNKL